MADLGSLVVSLSLNATNFNGSIAQVDRNMRALGSELRALQNRGSEYENSITGMTQKQNILNRSFDAAEVKLKEQRRRYDEMIAGGTATEAQIERQANAVNRAQSEYNRLERELAEITEQLRIQSSQWTQVGQRMQDVGGKLKSVGDGMTSVGKSLSMYVSAPLAALGVGAFKAAVDFESAFAGVRKTVDTTEEGFANLEKGIRDMAKAGPSSASELAEIMEMAGQLGIAEENLISFTSTMSDLSVATNMTAEQASTELARFANIVGMSQGDFNKLGSSIVALGNNFATTESEITTMALRLAGAGAQIGLSEADIMGLSTALSSVGIQAEMGGSAISKIMVDMQAATSNGGEKLQSILGQTGMTVRELQMMASHSGKAFGHLAEDLGMTKTELNSLLQSGIDLENFSKVAGMTGEQFKQAFEKDAIGALGAFISGLGKAEESGTSAIVVLEEMGITEVRLRDALLRAGNASEVFADAIKVSSNAWEENTALTNEAEQRYATTAAKLETLKNQVVDVGISLGDILIPMVLDVTEAIAPWIEKFASLSTETQKTILVLGGLAAAVGPVLIVGGTLISSIGTITTAIGGASLAIGQAGGVVALLSAKLGFLTPVLGALTGPVGLTAFGIAAIGTAAVVMAKELNESSIQLQDWSKGVTEATAEAVGGFVKISDDVGQTLTTLHLTSTRITDEIAADMTSKFDAMYSQIVEAANEKHTAHMESLQDFFLNSSALTSQEEEKILAKRQQSYDTEIEILAAKNQVVANIMQKAADENRELTEREKARIDEINQQMKEDAVRVLSESEVEQKVILEKMKADASEISALQAAEVVKNAVDQKEKVIEEANKQYEESIALITRMRDETGDISAEQAERMIAEAKKSRDQTIHFAEEMHETIVSEAKAQAGEHVDQVNWETGEIKSKWQVLKQDVSARMKEIGGDIKRDWSQAYSDSSQWVNKMATNVNNKFHEMGSAVGVKMNEAKSTIVKKWNEAEEFLRGINLVAIGKDIVQGLVNGIREKVNDVTESAKQLGQTVVKTVSNVLQRKSPSRVMIAIGQDTGKGLAIGIENTKKINKQAITDVTKVITDVTKQNAKEVAEIATKAENDRNKIHQSYAKKRRNMKKADAKKIKELESEMHADLKAINEKASIEIIKKEKELSKEKVEAIQKYIDDKRKANELSLIEEAQYWHTAYQQFKTNSTENIELRKAYKENVNRIYDALTNVNSTFVANAKKIDDDYIKNVEAANKKYDDAYKARYELAMKAYGLFEKVAEADPVSKYDLTANLQGQVANLNSWADQIKQLGNKKISKDLLNELQEMGPRALEELKALNSMTNSELTQYQKLYEEKSRTARNTATEQLKPLKNDVQREIEMLRETANAELDKLNIDWQQAIEKVIGGTDEKFETLHQVGKNAGEGLLKGLSSMEGPLNKKAKEIANSVSKTIKSSLKINSPSKVTEGYGVNIGEGLVVGMDDMLDEVSKSSMRLGQVIQQGTNVFSQNSPDYGKANQSSNLNLKDLVDVIVDLASRPIQTFVQIDKQTIASAVSTEQHNNISIKALTRGVNMQ